MDTGNTTKTKKIVIIGLLALGIISLSAYLYENGTTSSEESNPAPELNSEGTNRKELYAAYLEEGLKYKSEGDSGNRDSYYKAIESYQKATDISEGRVWVPYFNLGNVYRLVDDFENADKAYNKALEISSQDTLYMAKIEMYQYDMKKSEDEICAVYKEALSKNAENLDIVTKYAAYLRDIGRNEESLIYWKIALEKFPTDQRYKNEVANLEAKLNPTLGTPQAEAAPAVPAA